MRAPTLDELIAAKAAARDAYRANPSPDALQRATAAQLAVDRAVYAPGSRQLAACEAAHARGDWRP